MDEFEIVPGSEKIIGNGGYGVVQTMIVTTKSDPQQQRKLACKTINYVETAGNTKQQSTKDDVDREYKILSGLQHANIVQYVAFKWLPNQALLYMEYCEGGSLDDYIQRHRSETENEDSEEFVWKVFMQLASALMKCHGGIEIRTTESQSLSNWNETMIILHRDIKPANVLLSSMSKASAIVKLSDFGLGAILRPNSTGPSSYAGTPQYGAPEINRYTAGSLEWTKKCDIFSLGCTVYALCNYKPPFNGRMEKEDEKPDSLPEDFSDSLKELTTECLSYKPELRPGATEIFLRAQAQLAMIQGQPRPKTRLLGHKEGQLLEGASIAATTWPGWHYRVYFQDSSGGVREAKHDVGVWTGGDRQSAIFKAKLLTPLAVVSNNNGQESRVFSLNDHNKLQEYCYSNKGGWRPGSLNDIEIETAPYSNITAVWLKNGSIHLYFQALDTDAIQEYHWRPSKRRFQRLRCWPTSDTKWQKGATLKSDALKGTSLSAATWGHDCIRVYFQNTASELREQCCDAAGRGWYIGHVGHGVSVMPKNTPISAMAWLSEHSGLQIRVYWHDAKRNLLELKWSGGWNLVQNLDFMGITGFSAVQTDDGTNIRIYFQSPDHAIREKCFSSGGWYNGSRVDQVTTE